MTEDQKAELLAQIEYIEQTAAEFRKRSKRGKNTHEKSFWAGSAASHEINAVWLRGFLERCRITETA